MNDKEKDFLKIKQSIGKVSPLDLGILMRNYYKKHLETNAPAVKSWLDDSEGLFGPDLDLSVKDGKI